MLMEIIFLFFLLILSAFFSSTEMAYVLANKLKIELRARKNKFAEKNIQYYISCPQSFFSTILISNNIVNITFASLVTVFFTNIFHFDEIQILLISTFLLLIIGELLPKYFAMETADIYIKFAVVPLRIIQVLLYPLVKITSAVTNLITISKNQNEETLKKLFEREDLHDLVNESYCAGLVNEKESDMLKNVFEFSDQRIYEIMTPRTEIIGIELSDSYENIKKRFIESGYSKLPVFEDNLDNIKGILYLKDLFTLPNDISEIIRSVIFVPESKKSIEMLNDFLEKRVSICIVVDEFGGTAGLLTIEDIIEELFGEINDEFDTDDEICKKINDETYILSGKIEIDYINKEFNLNIQEGDYETVAGFITFKIGRIPENGESLIVDNFRINVLKSDKKRISLIKLLIEENLSK